jgi:hypothetical protein
MTLGNTEFLAIETMAPNDNDKYLIFNDGIQTLEDSFNRKIVVDTSAGNVTLLQSELVGNVFFECTGHVVPRTLFVPIEIVGFTTNPTKRTLFVKNDGTQPLTIDHVGSPGTDTVLQPTETGLIYADGTDIITVATGNPAAGGSTDFLGLTDTPGAFVAGNNVRVNVAGTDLEFTDEAAVPTLGSANEQLRVNGAGTALEFFSQSIHDNSDTPASIGTAGQILQVNPAATALEYAALPAVYTTEVQDEGAAEVTDPTFFNFIGAGVTAAINGAGVDITIPGGGAFTTLSDTPANYTGAGGQSVRVNVGETALEYFTLPPGAASIETQDEGVQIVAATDTLNFTGTPVTVTNPAANVTEINIVPTLVPLDFVTDAAANRVASNSDFSGVRIIDFNSASPQTYTVNTGLTASQPVTIVRAGAGTLEVVAGVGVTIQSALGNTELSEQFSHAVLTPRGPDVFYLAGDLS